MPDLSLKRRHSDVQGDIQSLLKRRGDSKEDKPKTVPCDCKLAPNSKDISCQNRFIEEMKRTLAESFTNNLELFIKNGETPEMPFNGRIVLLVPPSMHQRLHFRAESDRKSLNQWLMDVLLNELDKR